MKTRIITTAVALFAFCFANAQNEDMARSEMNSAKGITFSQGDMFIEGSIKISTGGATDFYAFNPKFGYFLNDKFAVGGQVSFSSNKEEAADIKTNVFGIGAFGRYYFLELGQKRFKAYAEAGLGYGRNQEEIAGVKNNDNSVTADINIGLNYFITKNLAATFTLANVLSYNSIDPATGSKDTFNVNINLFENIFDTPQFGLLYKF